MTKFVTNGVLTFYKNIPKVQSVRYDNVGEKVYSALKIQKVYAVFVSNVVDADEDLISWKDLSWVGQKIVNTDISVYVRSATSQASLQRTAWSGPYLNATTDISDFKDRYLQFAIVLTNTNISTMIYPIVRSVKVSYLSSDNSVKFFSKAFDLGFAPKHILLTYNGDVSEDSVVRFAVSGFDSVDINDYQYISPNKIQSLSELSTLSNKLKVMIEMVGDSGTLITIDEFALVFDGDQQLRLNEKFSSSSSWSSFSTDASESSSSLLKVSSSSSSVESNSSYSESSRSESTASESSESQSSDSSISISESIQSPSSASDFSDSESSGSEFSASESSLSDQSFSESSASESSASISSESTSSSSSSIDSSSSSSQAMGIGYMIIEGLVEPFKVS